MTHTSIADHVDHAFALFCRHRREVGYQMRPTLEKAQERGELYVSDHAAAIVWHRRDGQTTIHAIVSERPGEGSVLLDRILFACRQRWQHTLLARCPVPLPANQWYERRGFTLRETEPGKQTPLNVWVLTLR